MFTSGSTVVIKIGSASLVDPISLQPKREVFESIAKLVHDIKRSGHHAIIVSSGAVAIGRGILGCVQKPAETARVRALAALGQSKLMSHWENAFAAYNQLVAQVLVLMDENMHTKMNETASMLCSLLDVAVVPIINENDAIAPGTFNGNDNVALIVAGLINADVLAFLTDVDCLYTQNPLSNPNAKAVEIVENFENLKVDVSTKGTAIGTGGMETKILAARIASTMGITTIINNISRTHNLVNILHNMNLGVRRCSKNGLKNSGPPRCNRCMTGFAPKKRKTSLHTVFLPAKTIDTTAMKALWCQ